MSRVAKTISFWLDSPQPIMKDTAVTLGSFDGIHLGHKTLIEKLIKIAKKKSLIPVLLTFDPHPRLVLSKDMLILTTGIEREILLQDLGIKYIAHLRFTEEISRLPFDEFLKKYLVFSLGAKYVVIGYDHHFGKDRSGNPEKLKNISASLGFEVEAIPPVMKNGDVVKSNGIREFLLDGKIETANELLGHPYLIIGKCISGVGIGQRIGYPTANLEMPPFKLIPKDLVYAAWTTIMPHTEKIPSLVYIGQARTFMRTNRAFEVHMLQYEGAPLYGKNLMVWMNGFIREGKAFGSIEHLQNQIRRDIEKARELFFKNEKN